MRAPACHWESLIIAQIFAIFCNVWCPAAKVITEYSINEFEFSHGNAARAVSLIGVVGSLSTGHTYAHPFITWFGVVSRKSIQIEPNCFDSKQEPKKILQRMKRAPIWMVIIGSLVMIEMAKFRIGARHKSSIHLLELWWKIDVLQIIIRAE